MCYDITLLTDDRYVKPNHIDAYIQNILTEEKLLAEALKNSGMKVNRISWSDPEFNWADTRYACFRSTWDYFDRWKEFDQWLSQTAPLTGFINPLKLVRWNLDKHYLLFLEENGIPIVPTLMIEPGNSITLSEASLGFDSEEIVIKPAISGAARHTYRIHKSKISEYEQVFQTLVQQEAMMVQPFIQSILSEGEISLVMIGNHYSHAVLKKGKPGDFRVQDDFGGKVFEINANREAIQMAEAVINACPELPFYARIDLVRTGSDQWAVSELELVEPELFFRFEPEAAFHLAAEIKSRLRF